MQKQKRVNRFFLTTLLVFSIMSCDSNRVYDQYESVPNQWHKDAVISFSMTPPDTTNAYNLFINIRNTNDYKYSNLFLIAEMNYPNGKTVKDTLEYKMAKPDGELLGKGFTDVKENKLWYKGYESDFVFDESGEYTVRIQHAMRQNNHVEGITALEGITDIGFRIEQKQDN